MIESILELLQIVLALLLILIILIQQGRSSTMGTPIGGASQTLFGSHGASRFLIKLTCTLAFLLFATSLGLNFYENHYLNNLINQQNLVTQAQNLSKNNK